jgi:hypothetical protein
MSKPKMQRTAPPSGFWSGALFGTVTGMASLLTFQYLFGILRRPRLISKAILMSQEEFDDEEALGIFISAESLRSGIQTRRLTSIAISLRAGRVILGLPRMVCSL